jgi:hypothetical protein
LGQLIVYLVNGTDVLGFLNGDFSEYRYFHFVQKLAGYFVKTGLPAKPASHPPHLIHAQFHLGQALQSVYKYGNTLLAG